MPDSALQLRPAHLDDTAELARLSGELGYPASAAQRGHGIGSALLAACEQWAKTQGIHQLGLRSAEHRQEAHRFYRQHGYVDVKTSLTLRKTLASDGAPR